MQPEFKVKIIGGKIFKVPDFNYIKEHNILGSDTKSYLSNVDKYKSLSSVSTNHASYGIQSQLSNIERNKGLGTVSKIHDRYGIQGRSYPNAISYAEKHTGYMDAPRNGNRIDDLKGDFNVSPLIMSKGAKGYAYSQQMGNRVEAERNRLKALNQTYHSELEAEKVEQDIYEPDLTDEKDNTALSQQVYDCLKNTNKQKLVFALRAMQRLDTHEAGYITVRQFRDVLLMYQIFIIGGTLEKLIDKYKSNAGKINYTKLWNFVTESYNGKSSSDQTSSQKTTMLQQGVQSIEKDLRIYAHRYNDIFDFSDLINSIKKCDRSNTGVIGINELRILSRHYLPVSDMNLDLVLEHCNMEHTGWISYDAFIKILTDAQPTYLPPIKQNRRNTFVLEDKDLKTLQNRMANKRYANDYSEKNRVEDKRALEENNRDGILDDDRKSENNGYGLFNDHWKNESHVNTLMDTNRKCEDAGSGFSNIYRKYTDNANELSNNNRKNKGNSRLPDYNTSGEQSIVYKDNGKFLPTNQNFYATKKTLDPNNRQENSLSPRRKWYESEESWRKRKRKAKPKRKLLRRRWENSAPVISLRDSTNQDNDDIDSWHEVSDFSEDETVNAGKFQH